MCLGTVRNTVGLQFLGGPLGPIAIKTMKFSMALLLQIVWDSGLWYYKACYLSRQFYTVPVQVDQCAFTQYSVTVLKGEQTHGLFVSVIATEFLTCLQMIFMAGDHQSHCVRWLQITGLELSE